ncbi:B12-binding domain-containing radical SAM protein [Candidatus Pacearchaeota archaeon]|nr:B12-binding domain-containing radical SAM protein [Candidatus Pacearchaeota archaeon]
MPKNKIVLLNFLPGIDSTYENKGSIYPSTATMLLGTLLKKNGYDVNVIDGAYNEDYLKMLGNLIEEEVLYVGMTVMTPQIPFALEASKTVKKCNKTIPVIWGGPHPTLFPEQTLSDENVDIVAINEGAFTALRLAECLQTNKDLRTINGIGYKDKNTNIVITPPCELDDIHELPHFDFSLIDVDNYLNLKSDSVYQREFPDSKDKVRIMLILTGLGCPYKCEFCINPILKRRYRFRSAESIVEEIKYLKRYYDANTFLFLDEDFLVNKRRALEFVSLVEQEELHFNWRMWCRVDHFRDDYINSEFIRRLANIGHGSMVMGAESANQEILDCLKKDITPEQIMNSLNLLTGTSIFPRYSFMVGLEDETMEQIGNTYKFCLNMTKINPRVDIGGPFIFRLYPGSAIYQRLIAKYNLSVPDSLDSWIEHLKKETSFTEVPWTPKQFQKNLRLLTFYSSCALGSYAEKGRYPRRFFRLLLRAFCRLRLKYFFFRFPFEYWALSVLSFK